MDSLERRICKLERKNRFLTLTLVAVVLTGVSGFLLGQTSAKPKDASYRIVYANKFSLVDPRMGKTRASLSYQTHEGGWAGMTLWDEKGNPRTELKLWEDGRTHLLMMDANRKAQAAIKVSAAGKASIQTAGE